MIDFTKCEQLKRGYAGANGNKISVSVGIVLQDFVSLKNQAVSSERNGYGTELKDVLYTIDEQMAEMKIRCA